MSFSPAAQAVFDAWIAPARIASEQVPPGPKQALSQAIRAAADQVAPEEIWLEPYGKPVSVQRASARRQLNTARIARQEVRRQLFAIAAELEGGQ